MTEIRDCHWIDANDDLPALYLHTCKCSNPVLSDSTTPTQCDDCFISGACAIPGCDHYRMARYVLCARHSHIRYRHGHPLWTRQPLLYRAAHNRVDRAKGDASGYSCADGCGRDAHDWSYDGSDPEELTDPDCGLVYSLDPDRYEPRCRGCHQEHDGRQRDSLGRFTS